MNETDLSRRDWLKGAVAACAAGAITRGAGAGVPAPPPNIVLILADDLGYGDLGCYGQQDILTPNLDRMAAEGMRFTQCYAGSTVCAPSRGSLMTGLHTGHSPIRGNGVQFLGDDDVTMAHVLQNAGYETALVGKWGLGDAWSDGIPRKQGFDSFFGYLNHLHAHNYFPASLYWNERPIPIPGNLRTFDERQTYAPDLFTGVAERFIETRHENPFFLFLSYTTPHANTFGSWLGADGLPVPSDMPYSDEPWPRDQKHYAAMITRMDAAIGRILDTLRETGQDGNTLVIFTSDNGPHREGGGDPNFFNSAGGLRGIKRDLYEGGIRVPMIAWWPGMIEAGADSDLPCAFWDVLPTFTELAGGNTPPNIDGLSIVPELLGEETAGQKQVEHEFLYWEFDEGGFRQALRMSGWKAVTPPRRRDIELYDLVNDPGETTDLAAQFPDVTAQIRAVMDDARTPANSHGLPSISTIRPRRRFISLLNRMRP